MKLGDGGGGEDGLKRLGKRAADDDSLEGEGPGGGDAADESGGTKRDTRTPRDGDDGPPAPADGPQAPSPPPACPQDQHHFLRSSVRPQSKRLRKDSSCAGGSGSAGGSGPRGKGEGDLRRPRGLVGGWGAGIPARALPRALAPAAGGHREPVSVSELREDPSPGKYNGFLKGGFRFLGKDRP